MCIQPVVQCKHCVDCSQCEDKTDVKQNSNFLLSELKSVAQSLANFRGKIVTLYHRTKYNIQLPRQVRLMRKIETILSHESASDWIHHNRCSVGSPQNKECVLSLVENDLKSARNTFLGFDSTTSCYNDMLKGGRGHLDSAIEKIGGKARVNHLYKSTQDDQKYFKNFGETSSKSDCPEDPKLRLATVVAMAV